MDKSYIYHRLKRTLAEKTANDLFRTLPGVQNFELDVSTNSYLAVESRKEVSIEALRLLEGNLAGNLASRLIGSRSALYSELERELADWKSTESSLIFNSGYAANVGIIQALATRDTVIFSDKLNHASIVDGIRLSKAKMIRYRHCDMDDLHNRLNSCEAEEKIIVTDSVFSMDGNRAPLEAICDLAARSGALVMVDEAHATGIFGKKLSGLVEECGLEEVVDIRMGTLSKAVGGLGGFFAGSKFLRDYLVNTARSLIYSTALPHSVLAFDLASVRYIRNHPLLGLNLLSVADQLRQKIQDLGFDTLNSTSQIIPCLIGNDKKCLELSRFFREKGIKVPAIRPPTVPIGTARLRFSINSELNSEHMEALLAVLREWKDRQ